jgi:dihydropteroate synthase
MSDSAELHCGRFRLSLTRPRVMGIVNLTPDSFSDGGRFYTPSAAIEHARQLVEQGADILDLGAESSRPGAQPVSAEEEWRRLETVLREVVQWNVPVSVDTAKPQVMGAAIDAGCDMINDINGFRTPGAVEAVAGSRVAVCIMHMQGEPRTMQLAPAYEQDVVHTVCSALSSLVDGCLKAGITKQSICLDPGFGFGKTVEHNLQLASRLSEVAALGYPVLVGWSRKSTLGTITGRAVGERMPASIAAALHAAAHGAHILRVHDVRETVDALKVWQALQQGSLSDLRDNIAP